MFRLIVLAVVWFTSSVSGSVLAGDTGKDETTNAYRKLCSLDADWKGEWKGTVTFGKQTHRIEKVRLSDCLACDTCGIRAIRLAFDFEADDLKVTLGYPRVENHIYLASRLDDLAFQASGGPQLILESFTANRDGQRLMLKLRLMRIFIFAKEPQKDLNVSVVLESKIAKGKVTSGKTTIATFELSRLERD